MERRSAPWAETVGLVFVLRGEPPRRLSYEEGYAGGGRLVTDRSGCAFPWHRRFPAQAAPWVCCSWDRRRLAGRANRRAAPGKTHPKEAASGRSAAPGLPALGTQRPASRRASFETLASTSASRRANPASRRAGSASPRISSASLRTRSASRRARCASQRAGSTSLRPISASQRAESASPRADSETRRSSARTLRSSSASQGAGSPSLRARSASLAKRSV